jgi:putative DNA methylase
MSLDPYSWKDRPSLIEKLFPVQKLSVESFKEQMAGSGKALTSLGSYWKGRKPLILNKACVLGCLLPATQDLLQDLKIFEMLMAMDSQSLIKRLKEKGDRPSRHIIEKINAKDSQIQYCDIVKNARRPEECAPILYSHVWDEVNQHLGTTAKRFAELVEQIGVARFGHCPKIADLFCGSGQIPFEAARLGCEVYANDLNPVACMLTWGAFNVVGASQTEKQAIEKKQSDLANEITKEIHNLGFETNSSESYEKIFLYCVEVICPESGWKVPLLPNFIISQPRSGIKNNVVVRLEPIKAQKKYRIRVIENVSPDSLLDFNKGTVRGGEIVHSPDGITEYRIKISTLRGDYSKDGVKKNRLRMWDKADVFPRSDDIYQERLYCIQWTIKNELGRDSGYQFKEISESETQREVKLNNYVKNNLIVWQEKGWIPDMVIEKGYNTDQPIRERGWTHWHHLFNPRQLLMMALARQEIDSSLSIALTRVLNQNSRLSRWDPNSGGGGCVQAVFDNQALNTLLNYGCRGSNRVNDLITKTIKSYEVSSDKILITCHSAENITEANDIYITDPPYGDAVKYEEITEFFIAWLCKNTPQEFSNWTWDSRRALAIKGEDEDFRQGMIRAYKAMADHMPENGIQVLMFTHKSGSIWADMANIVWASGLQVTAAWYVVTETDSALRQGANVTGTILLILRKRTERLVTFRDDLAWEIKEHVKEQMDSLTGLDKSVREQNSEGLYNDADLQMAGYAAALKVLTTYSVIDGKDMEVKAKAPRQKGVKGFVDEMIEFAIQNTVEYLVPSSFDTDDWKKLSAIERYYLKMIDMEAQGEKSLDNYQNFAKAFKIRQFEDLMGVSRANSSRLMVAEEFKSSLMSGDSEIAGSLLRALLYAMWETQKNIEMDEILSHLMDNCGAQYLQSRHLLITMAQHIADRREGIKPTKLYEAEASAARVLSEAIQGHRL